MPMLFNGGYFVTDAAGIATASMSVSVGRITNDSFVVVILNICMLALAADLFQSCPPRKSAM